MVCKSVNDTSHFKRSDTNETFSILKGPLIVILIMSFIYLNVSNVNIPFILQVALKTKFRYRINNCKSTQRKFGKKYVEKDLTIVTKKGELKQKLFQEHYCSEGHQAIENLSFTLIDQVDDLDSLRKKKLYWINRLNTWA